MAPPPPTRLNQRLLAQMTKFNVLLTSYEMLRDDPELFRSIPWRVCVVDEAHRLKNKDSAMAMDLRALRPEYTLMLTGTPLQNNTTELWALMSLIDPELFPSLEAFEAQYGTLKSAEQVEELKEKIRPYLLRRQKVRGSRTRRTLQTCTLTSFPPPSPSFLRAT